MITKYMTSFNKNVDLPNPVTLTNDYSDVLNILETFESITNIDKLNLKSPVLVSSVDMFSITPQCSVNLYSTDELLTVLLVSSIDSSRLNLYDYLVDVYEHYKVDYDVPKLKDFCKSLYNESFQFLDSFIKLHKEEIKEIRKNLSVARPPRILVNSNSSEETKFLVKYFAKEISVYTPSSTLIASTILKTHLASGMFGITSLPNSLVQFKSYDVSNANETLNRLFKSNPDFTDIEELSNLEYPDVFSSIILLECVNNVLGRVMSNE